MQLVYFVEVLLQQPIVPVALGLIVAVLYGAGRSAGLPRLFWHEHRLPRFLAGLATTFLAGQCLLDSYLLDAHRRFPDSGGLYRFLGIGAGGWLLIVGVRSAELWLHSSYPQFATSARAKAASIAPLLHRAGPKGTSVAVGIYVHPGAFIAGVLVALGIAVLMVAAVWTVRLPNAVSSVLASLARWRPVADPRLHVLQAMLFGSLLVLFIALRRWATPAIGICMLFALVIGAQGATDFWLRNSGFGLLALLALLWWGGTSLRKLRIPALRPAYVDPVAYPPAVQPRRQPLPPFDADPSANDVRPATKRLVVVCASGGGIRAATWTASILGRIDELVPAFRAATRLVTGASGGMVGAASWLAFLHGRQGVTPDRESWQRLAEAVSTDSLTPMARRLVFSDIPSAFLPWVNRHDRGLALEEAWCANLKSSPLQLDLGVTFSDLRDGEKKGLYPTLVFSPMLVEDGRRLIFSNRDFSNITNHQVRWLSSAQHEARPSTEVASRSAYHIADLFPKIWEDIPISTAARLSAAFPFASPAVVLPSEPRRRVVDAGYYDNYGLELACGWLRSLLQEHEAWLKDNVTGILLIQIRDNVSDLSVNPDTDRVTPGDNSSSDGSTALSRGFEGITSPVSGVLSARESVTLFRNDSQLETVSQLYANTFDSVDFLSTTIFEFRGGASLSWTLASDEVDLLKGQAGGDSIKTKIDAISAWMNRRGYWAEPQPSGKWLF